MKTDVEKMEIIKAQEKALVFPKLDSDTIVAIAKIIVAKLREEKQPGYVLASVGGCTIYAESLPGAMPDNADWARRKGNLVMLYNRSSYLTTLTMKSKGKDLSTRGLPLSEYCLFGGAFPIKLGDLTVGFISASGTNQEHEHQTVANGIAEYFGVAIPSIFD